MEKSFALVVESEVVEAWVFPVLVWSAGDFSELSIGGGAEGVVFTGADIGDGVGVLVPDISGVDPVILAVAEDSDVGHSSVV